jgi:hypothetical protein
LKLIVPDIPIHTLSKIVAAIQSIDINPNIKEIKGEEIANYYNHPNISNEGILGNSCMNRMENEIFQLYTKNTESVRLIVYEEDEYLLARALLWKTNKGWVMDRVYYSNDKYFYTFEKYAKEKGYKNKNEINSSYTVKLNNSKFDKYPYLDTFNYLCINKKELCNDDIFENDDKVILLQDTSGDFEVIRNVRKEFEEIDTLKGAHINIKNLIKYSIDNKKFIKDLISDEFENYYSYPNDFLSSYDYIIKEYFNELNLKEIDNTINKDNYYEKILDFHQNYSSKYEDIVMKVIKLKYENYTWNDLHEETHGGELNYLEMDAREKIYWNNFIDRYCDLDILNDNLRKLYDKNYDKYVEIYNSIMYF